MWGTGMYPAQQGCGFNPMMSEEIQGIKAEQQDLKEELKDIKDDIRRARTRAKTAEKALADVKSRFQKNGLGGGAFNIIDRHISGGRSCDSYATEDCPASRKGRVMSDNDFKLDPIDALLALNDIGSAPVRHVASTKVPPGKIPNEVGEEEYIVAPPEGQPTQHEPNQDDGASVPDGEIDCGPSRSSTSPFSPGVWSQACQGSSVSGSYICRQGVDQGPNFNDRLCESLLRDWVEKKKDADEALAKVGELEGELSRLNIEKADKQSEYKDAVKESREEYRRTLTEGGCIECMMQGQSYYQQQRKPNWLEVGGNLLLGVGSMYFGNQQQRYISDNNAKLGFPTQSYPAIGFGYPYFMNALYGAVGGGMSSGGFGCGGGMGGGGGAFGYPPGTMGGSMSGDLSNGGGGAFGHPSGMMVRPDGAVYNGSFGVDPLGYNPNGAGFMSTMDPMALQMPAQLTESSMSQNRIVTGLAMEIQTLHLRLRQAQSNLANGGYLGFEAGLGHGMQYNGSSLGGGIMLPFHGRQAPSGFLPYGSPPTFR